MDAKKLGKINWSKLRQGVSGSGESQYKNFYFDICIYNLVCFAQVKRELAFADPIQEVIEDADLNKTEAADVWACRSRNQASSYKNLIDKLSNY